MVRLRILPYPGGAVYPSYTKIVHRNKPPQSSVFSLRHYLMYKQQPLQKTLFVSLGSPNLVVDINCEISARLFSAVDRCFPRARLQPPRKKTTSCGVFRHVLFPQMFSMGRVIAVPGVSHLPLQTTKIESQNQVLNCSVLYLRSPFMKMTRIKK